MQLIQGLSIIERKKILFNGKDSSFGKIWHKKSSNLRSPVCSYSVTAPH